MKFELEGEEEVEKPKVAARIVVIGKPKNQDNAKRRDENGSSMAPKMAKVVLSSLPRDQGPPCGLTEEALRIREMPIIRVTGGA